MGKSKFTPYSDTSWPYEVLKRVPGVLECVQQVGDTMYVPDNWFHSTYNTGPWTVSMAGEGEVTGRFHSAACLGDLKTLQGVSLEVLANDTDFNRRNPLH